MGTTELIHYISDNAILLFLIVLLNFALLLLISSSAIIKSSLLKELIYIPSRHSRENTLLLGGMAMAFSNIMIMHNNYSSDLVSTSEKFSALGYILSVFILTIQGYLDDKFELSLRAKIIGYSFTILIYSLFLYFSSPIKSILLFIVFTTFWGIGTLNGTHVLETAQTMSEKVATVILSFYFAAALYFNLSHLSYIILLLWLPIVCFTVFSKFKSNIRLGEIGPSVIGISLIFISTQFYLNLSETLGHMNALCISLAPLSIPIGEILFNATKKIFSNSYSDSHPREIFKHYLSTQGTRSATKQATKVSLMYLVALTMTFLLMTFSSFDSKYLIAFIANFAFLISIYFIQASSYLKMAIKNHKYGNLTPHERSRNISKEYLQETFEIETKDD